MSTHVLSIKENVRKTCIQERQDHRSLLFNQNRKTLGEVECKYKTYDVNLITELAMKIKQKNSLTLQDLLSLKQGLIQSEQNIYAFINVTGALHALVRELTGSNSRFKLEAAYCLCNLALGDEKCGLKITKAAAPYLMSHLDCLNNVFLEACIWTLGNLAGSGEKSVMILHSQGLLPKLLKLLFESEDVLQSTAYALTLFVNTGYKLLSVSEVENIAHVVCSLLKKEPAIYWLLFILTCNEACDQIFLESSVVTIIINILCKFDLNSVADHNRTITYLTALVRCLGNLCAQRLCAEELMKNYCEQPFAVELLLTNLLTSKYPHIQKETIWFMGNLFRNCEHSQVLASKLETSMVKKKIFTEYTEPINIKINVS